MDNRKIIVTGGAGFIGAHTVVELSEAGYDPIIVDDFSNSEKEVIRRLSKIIGQEVKCYEGDCGDLEFMEKVFQSEKNVSGVIHFAANKSVGESVREPLKYYSNNVGGLLIVLQLMLKYKVKELVFSSSCTVYGNPDYLPVTESSPLKEAASPYGETKRISERVIQDVVQSGQPIKAISLRYFNPIGAHESHLIGELPLGVPSNLVPFITQTAANVREKLVIFGDDYQTPDGTCIRDYIHVVDLAKAHLSALNKLFNEGKDHFLDVFNVGLGVGHSVMEIVKLFEKVTGQKLNYEIGPRREGDVEAVYADTTRVNRELGWKAERNIAKSLKDAWEWQKTLT